MISGIAEALRSTWEHSQTVFLIYALGLALERALPAAQPNQPGRDIAFNFQYTLVFLFLSSLLLPHFQTGAAFVHQLLGSGLGLSPPFPEGTLGFLVRCVVFIVVFDFFYYWWHRLQHSPVLWPQHMFHHADRSVNVTTGIRHHWLEEPLRAFLIWLPMNLIFGLKPIEAAGFGLFLALWGYFTHLNIRLDLGPLTPWLAGPQFHRIHHSIRTEHQNKNFAAYLPFWDVIFGTYCRPAHDEYPPTGLPDRDSEVGIIEGSLYPFVAFQRAIRGVWNRWPWSPSQDRHG